jgi:hypothetical protein
MTNNHDGTVVESSEPSYNSSIVAKHTVSMELEEVPSQLADIIQCTWTLRVAGQLSSLPGSKVLIKIVFDLGKLCTKLPNVVLGRRLAGGSCGREFLNLLFDLSDRLLKLEVISHRRSAHSSPITHKRAMRHIDLPESTA